MQHGNARPLAVKYISDQGRRQSDQGEFSSVFFKLRPGSDAAPDALKMIGLAWPGHYQSPTKRISLLAMHPNLS